MRNSVLTYLQHLENQTSKTYRRTTMQLERDKISSKDEFKPVQFGGQVVVEDHGLSGLQREGRHGRGVLTRRGSAHVSRGRPEVQRRRPVLAAATVMSTTVAVQRVIVVVVGAVVQVIHTVGSQHHGVVVQVVVTAMPVVVVVVVVLLLRVVLVVVTV